MLKFCPFSSNSLSDIITPALTWAGNQCYIDAAALMCTPSLSAFSYFHICPIKCHSSFVSILPIDHSVLHPYLKSQVGLSSFMSFRTPLPFFLPFTILSLPFPCGSNEKEILKNWEERKRKWNILCYKTAPQLEKLWLICSFQHTSFFVQFSDWHQTNIFYHENLHLPFDLVPSHFPIMNNVFQEFYCFNIM